MTEEFVKWNVIVILFLIAFCYVIAPEEERKLWAQIAAHCTIFFSVAAWSMFLLVTMNFGTG